MNTSEPYKGSVIMSAWTDRRFRVARTGLLLLISVALLADFIANDKPLYCRIDGEIQFPALHKMFANLGLAQWPLSLETIDWKNQVYESVVFAPVPYSAGSTDLNNANFRGPFATQQVSAARFRHWLGTDHLGRDVLAGLIHGARIAILLGLCSMLLAAALGIPLGAYAGFLGDDLLRIGLPQCIVLVLAGIVGIFFTVMSLTSDGTTSGMFMLLVVITVLCAIGINVLLRKWKFTSRTISIPVDSLTLRSIEVVRSIPVFFLLFAILGMISTPRMIFVILLIGFLWSPSIIRFVRAEALRLRKETYIQSARVLGLSYRQIVWRHIIPNAIGPALIMIAFGIGSAVLVESGLSFLGIGIAPETVSWGKMLNLARSNFSAWWMVLLPGAAIFITIAIFNRLGDVLEQHMSGRGN